MDPLLEIEEPRRSRALMWLFAAAVFGVAAALAFSLTQGGARTDSSAVATGGAETASSTGPESPVPPVSEAAPATREEVAMAAEDPTPPPEMPQPASDPARLREAVASATQGLAASLPATHRVHLDGTEGARVLLGERELGRLPLDLELPRLSATVELRFERRGFQPRTVAVSLDQEAVRVDLERRRAQPATETPTEAPSETPVRLPFEEAPIYD